MDLQPSDEQAQLMAGVSAMLAKHSSPDVVRAAEPTGFDADLWSRLLELGVVAMSVGEAVGGWGGSLLDQALVAEAIGYVVAPAPVIEAQVASRLLERIGGGLATETLRAVLDEARIVTMALHPSVDGVARLVPAAAAADSVIVLSGGGLLLVDLDDSVRQVENLGSMPVADVVVPESAPALVAGPDALAAHDRALDDWCCLTASALVGIGRRSVEIGVEYTSERRAWGVPIGSFQAVSHPLVDAATAVDAAGLVARKAAWATDADEGRFGELAAMAFGLAQEAARDASHRSLHFHGGYGFMMEYDIQLYYRRARAWANVFGGPSAVHRRVADRRYGPVGRAVNA